MSFASQAHYTAPPAYERRTWLYVLMILWTIILVPILLTLISLSLFFSYEATFVNMFTIYFSFDFSWTIFSLVAKEYFTTGNMFIKNVPWAVIGVVLAGLGTQCVFLPSTGYILASVCFANYLLLSTTSWWKPYKLIDLSSKVYGHSGFSQPQVVAASPVYAQPPAVVYQSA